MQAGGAPLQTLETMLQHRPLDLRLHEALLGQYQAAGNFPKVLAHCDFVLQVAPTHAVALAMRAQILLEVDAPPLELASMGQPSTGSDISLCGSTMRHLRLTI